MKYNLSEIMHKAWKLYRKGVGSFAEALHRAWSSAKAEPINAQRIEDFGGFGSVDSLVAVTGSFFIYSGGSGLHRFANSRYLLSRFLLRPSSGELPCCDYSIHYLIVYVY